MGILRTGISMCAQVVAVGRIAGEIKVCIRCDSIGGRAQGQRHYSEAASAESNWL